MSLTDISINLCTTKMGLTVDVVIAYAEEKDSIQSEIPSRERALLILDFKISC